MYLFKALPHIQYRNAVSSRLSLELLCDFKMYSVSKPNFVYNTLTYTLHCDIGIVLLITYFISDQIMHSFSSFIWILLPPQTSFCWCHETCACETCLDSFIHHWLCMPGETKSFSGFYYRLCVLEVTLQFLKGFFSLSLIWSCTFYSRANSLGSCH